VRVRVHHRHDRHRACRGRREPDRRAHSGPSITGAAAGMPAWTAPLTGINVAIHTRHENRSGSRLLGRDRSTKVAGGWPDSHHRDRGKNRQHVETTLPRRRRRRRSRRRNRNGPAKPVDDSRPRSASGPGHVVGAGNRRTRWRTRRRDHRQQQVDFSLQHRMRPPAAGREKLAKDAAGM
jgi:hypothetical protein